MVGRLLPLVILTELGGGLLVLFGLKTRWAAIALFGFCLLTALFVHSGADYAIQLRKNVAMAGATLLWRYSVLSFITRRVARPRHLTKVAAEGARPIAVSKSVDFGHGAPISLG